MTLRLRKADRQWTVPEYCAHPAVQRRMREYCGDEDADPTCAYIAGLDDECGPFPTWEHPHIRPPEKLEALAARGGDLGRSIWDRDNLVFLIELDYENPDDQGEPFLHPNLLLSRLEPAYRLLRARFRQWRCQPLVLLTGRGYHFAGRIPLEHVLVDELAELVPATPPWLEDLEARRPPGVRTPLTARTARAWTGLGLLLEYLAHAVLRQIGAQGIPVVVNGTVVGGGPAGRAAVSVDFSHAGDPLDQRQMRLAFGPYQYHRLRPDIFGEAAADLPPLVTLPRRDRPLSALLSLPRTLATGVREAASGSTPLPDVSAGLLRALRNYGKSPLAAFHRRFFFERTEADPGARSTAGLPQCFQAILERPNDLLLRPAHVQHVVRGLLSRGWRAVDIAALVTAAYESNQDWGDRWQRLHAATRADFDVRVFAGLIEARVDRLVDFNCVSAQEKDLCPRGECPFDLRVDRGRLESRFP